MSLTPRPAHHAGVFVVRCSAHEPVGRRRRAALAIESEVQLVRRRLAANLPTLGICFGSQLLCHALGGSVEHLDSGSFMDWELPESDIDELTAPWFFIHEDQMRLPEGAEPLARADHATVAFRQGNAWGLQFHAEVDADVLRLWFDDLGFDSARTSPHLRCVEERAERNRKDAFALFDRFCTRRVSDRAPASDRKEWWLPAHNCRGPCHSAGHAE